MKTLNNVAAVDPDLSDSL